MESRHSSAPTSPVNNNHINISDIIHNSMHGYNHPPSEPMTPPSISTPRANVIEKGLPAAGKKTNFTLDASSLRHLRIEDLMEVISSAWWKKVYAAENVDHIIAMKIQSNARNNVYYALPRVTLPRMDGVVPRGQSVRMENRLASRLERPITSPTRPTASVYYSQSPRTRKLSKGDVLHHRAPTVNSSMLIIKESVEPEHPHHPLDNHDPKSDPTNQVTSEHVEDITPTGDQSPSKSNGRDESRSSSRLSLSITLPPRSRYPSQSEPTDAPSLNPLGSRRPSMVNPAEIMNAIRLEIQEQLMKNQEDDSNNSQPAVSKIPFSENPQDTNLKSSNGNVVQDAKKKLSPPRLSAIEHHINSNESKYSNKLSVSKSTSSKPMDTIEHADSESSWKSDVLAMPSEESFVSVSSHSVQVTGRKPVRIRSPRPPPKSQVKSNVPLKRKSAKAVRHPST